MPEDQLSNQENYRTEYKEVTSTYRFYVSLRFIVAAFTATIQSAFLNTYGQMLQKPSVPVYTIMIPLVGIIMMFAVFAIEQRTISVFGAMVRRGKELEFNLGLIGGQFSWLGAPETIRPKRWKRFMTHTWGIRLIYGIIFALWTVLLILHFTNYWEGG